MLGSKENLQPKIVREGYITRLIGRIKGDQPEVVHSEALIEAFSSSIDEFVKNLFRKNNLLSAALSDLNAAHIARQFEHPRNVELTEKEYLDARGIDDYLLGWDKPNKITRAMWPSLEDHRNWKKIDTEITCNDLLRISEKNNSLASRLTGRLWEEIKQLNRIRLPKRITREAGAYISRGGFKMQQLYEADPDFLTMLRRFWILPAATGASLSTCRLYSRRTNRDYI